MIGYSNSTGKYQASLRIMGRLVFLGEYSTFKEAERAVDSAAAVVSHGHRSDLDRLCANR